MKKLTKYCCLVIFLCAFFNSEAQYLCDYEMKILNREKRKVKRDCISFSKDWIKQYRDSLNVPEKIKSTGFKFLPREDEYEKGVHFPFNQWESIDSLLCVNERKQYVNQALDQLQQLKLTTYQIMVPFTPTNAPNPEISSQLHFQFDVRGNLLRIILRTKEMSKTSEVFFH